MPWHEKASATEIRSELEGSFYLNGDVVAETFGQARLSGKTYPTIVFPSGLIRELVNPQSPNPNIRLFGRFEVPVNAAQKAVVASVLSAYSEYPDLTLQPISDSALLVGDRRSRRSYRLTFRDNHISDISPYPREAMELLPGDLRAVLPPIRTTDGKGWEAVAPLKIFSPDSNWTWYPTEFDGVDEFFGLVIGFEAELGYFSLSELESLRGGLGLPLERDLYYAPKSLQELYNAHLDST